MAKKFRVALVQMDTNGDIDRNLKSIETLCEEASKNAQMVIFPEHSDGIGKRDAEFESEIPGKISNLFSSLAKKHGIYLHCGSITEKGPENKPYNTSLMFSPKGEIIAKYSKLHLFDVDLPDGTGCRESSGASFGNEIVTVDTELGKMGLAICYDIRFPELFRAMALNGAEIFVICANFTAPTGEHHWKPLLQARAIENGCYVFAVNQCGNKPQFEAYGHSMVIDPWGRILGELEQSEGILYADIDLKLVEDTRRKIPSLKNRRTDIY